MMATPAQLRDYGQQLDKVRRARGLSQLELAAIAGVDPSTISLHERGKVAPRWITLCEISHALSVDPERLWRPLGVGL